MHMINFFFAGVMRHPAVAGAKYVMRMDTDSTFVSAVPNLFEALERLTDIDYVSASQNIDCGDIVRGLTAFTRQWAATHNATRRAALYPLLERRSAAGRLTPNHKFDSECVWGYYNNFEILRLRRFTHNAVYMWWVADVEKSLGIYRHRWGDAILRRLGCAASGCRAVYFDELAPTSRYCHRAVCYGLEPRKKQEETFQTPVLASKRQVAPG